MMTKTTLTVEMRWEVMLNLLTKVVSKRAEDVSAIVMYGAMNDLQSECAIEDDKKSYCIGDKENGVDDNDSEEVDVSKDFDSDNEVGDEIKGSDDCLDNVIDASRVDFDDDRMVSGESGEIGENDIEREDDR